MGAHVQGAQIAETPPCIFHLGIHVGLPSPAARRASTGTDAVARGGWEGLVPVGLYYGFASEESVDGEQGLTIGFLAEAS